MTSAATLYSAIDQRCRADPTQGLDDAAEALFLELMTNHALAGIR